MHDRFILTDQRGISTPGGLDCRSHSQANSMNWNLLDEMCDYADGINDPPVSLFELLAGESGDTMTVLSAEELRNRIIHALCKQGYRVQDGVIQMPENPSKEDYRALNELALERKLEVSGPAIRPHEDRLIQSAADGPEDLASAARGTG